MISIEGLYDTLLSASIGGMPFAVIDTSEELGRRVQRFLFPGVDQPEFQDLGVLDGPLRIRGLLAGDDYVEQAQNLRQVLRGPGPLSLEHPAIGNVQVVLASPANISFAVAELRIARFEATFYLYTQPPGTLADTLSALLSSVQATIDDAEGWLAGVLQPAVMALAAFGYAQSWISGLASMWANLTIGGSSGAEIGAAAAPAIAALEQPTTAPAPGWGAMAAANLAAVPAAIATSSNPVQPSAVAPGGAMTAAAAADPMDATTMLLQAVPAANALAVPLAPGPELATAMQAIIVVNAIQAASNVDWPSQQAAEAEAALIYAALDAAITAAAEMAALDPANAAPVWRDLLACRAAFSADMNSMIGRLPAVVDITTPTVLPAWLIAQYVAGDTPDDVFATYQDIVARNNVIHPALVPAGTVEVLAQ